MPAYTQAGIATSHRPASLGGPVDRPSSPTDVLLGTGLASVLLPRSCNSPQHSSIKSQIPCFQRPHAPELGPSYLPILSSQEEGVQSTAAGTSWLATGEPSGFPFGCPVFFAHRFLLGIRSRYSSAAPPRPLAVRGKQHWAAFALAIIPTPTLAEPPELEVARAGWGRIVLYWVASPSRTGGTCLYVARIARLQTPHIEQLLL